MVNRGGFVVETWLLSARFSRAKIFLFFEIYFGPGKRSLSAGDKTEADPLRG
jgi:hypothetical protein